MILSKSVLVPKREGEMPFGRPRTDVRKALEEALSSGAHVKLDCCFIGGESEEIGYLKSLAEDRVIIGRNKDDLHGVPTMLVDIKTVSIWQEPGDSPRPHPDPEPVDSPSPKSGSPGKREKVPVADEPVKAMAS